MSTPNRQQPAPWPCRVLALTVLTLGAMQNAAQAQPAAAPRPAAAPAAQSAAQRFEATVQGVRTELLLLREGERLSGQFTESGLVLPLTGQARGTRLTGRIEGPPGSGISFPFEADLAGDALNLRLTLAPGRPANSLSLHRVGSGPLLATGLQGSNSNSSSSSNKLAATATIDPALVGRWVRESVINSPGGAGGFASFATQRSLTLAADGRARQTLRSAGGSSQWSQAGGEELEFSGRWQVRGAELWVMHDGQTQYVQVARYAIFDGRLVVYTPQGRQIWSR